MSFQASKLQAPRSIAVEHVDPASEIPDDWVRIRLAVAGICGTDMHYYRHFENAGFKLQRPLTLGHEACGHVLEPNGSDFEVGQLVALNPIIACGECDYCQAGEENLCRHKRFPGSATTVPHIDGFFQQVFDFPASSCHAVSTEIMPRHLAFAEPLACSLHAVNIAGVGPGTRVVVLGCGPMGLLAIVAAVSLGAEVSCVDLRAEAAAMGMRMGATQGLTLGQFDETDFNEYFDVAIEASGAVPAFNQAMEWLKKQGVLSILSNFQPGAAGLNLHRIMLKELRVMGSFQFNQEFRQAIAVISSGRFDFDALIARQVGVGDTAEALELALSGTLVGKIQILGEAEAAS